jgi:hypothetical protein
MNHTNEMNILVFSTVFIFILRVFHYKMKRCKSCNNLQELDDDKSDVKTISEDLSSDGYDSQEDDLMILEE